jgi:hypothetical protein
MLLSAGSIGAFAHAETFQIHAGSVADCIPSPSIEAIKSASIFQGENPALVQMATCDVIKGQPLPAQSRLYGEIRAVSALGPYSLVWQRLQLRSDQGDIVWSPEDDSFVSSRIQSNGTLRMTFERTLDVDVPTTPN